MVLCDHLYSRVDSSPKAGLIDTTPRLRRALQGPYSSRRGCPIRPSSAQLLVIFRVSGLETRIDPTTFLIQDVRTRQATMAKEREALVTETVRALNSSVWAALPLGLEVDEALRAVSRKRDVLSGFGLADRTHTGPWRSGGA